jgi:single-strand DNA-binding protein
MSIYCNQIQLIGCINRDVELKTSRHGGVMARASMATREVYKNEAGEKVIEVYWHNLIAWGKLAEMMHVLCKQGKEVVIQGKLTHRNYESKDGISRHISEIVVSEFLLIS